MDLYASSRVDEVDPDVIVLHQDLALLGFGHGHVGLVLQHLRPAILLNDHRLHRLGYGSHRAYK